MDEDERRHFQLAENHRNLEERIREEQRRPLPDTILLARLKREKLIIKEQLDQLVV